MNTNFVCLTSFVQPIPLKSVNLKVVQAVLKNGTRPQKWRTISSCSSNLSHSPYLESVETKIVKKASGKPIKIPWERPNEYFDTMELAKAQVDLPNTQIPNLNNLWPRRISKATIIGHPDNIDPRNINWLQDSKVVVFAHGLTQPPENYRSTLQRLAVLGYTVIAPQVSILDVLFPWQMVESLTSFTASPFMKLQYALAIDIARSVQMAKSCGATKVHTLGHGIGGASLLMYANSRTPFSSSSAPENCHDTLRKDPFISSISLLAPYTSSFNDYSTKSVKDNTNYFDFNITNTSQKLEGIPLLMLHGENDAIANHKSTETFFQNLKGREGYIGFGSFPDGYHIGFEDSLTVKVPGLSGKAQQIFAFLFTFIDFTLFKKDIFNVGIKDQLKETKAILESFIENYDKSPEELGAIMEEISQEIDIPFQNHRQEILVAQ